MNAKTRSPMSVISRIEKEIEYERKLKKWSSNVDRRYAWVVLFALFMIMAVTLGTYRTFGLIFAKIVKDNVYTREEASWPVATIFTTENCIGPIVSMIVYYFSCRQSLFIGSVFLIIGNGLTYYSNTLMMDILLLGFVQGLGYGFILMPLMEIVNSYFFAYRTIALGLALSGSTVAVFALTPIFKYLLEYYHYRMAYAAIGLVCCINLIMVPLLKPNVRPKQPRDDDAFSEEQDNQLNRNQLIRISSRAFKFQSSLRGQKCGLHRDSTGNNSSSSLFLQRNNTISETTSNSKSNCDDNNNNNDTASVENVQEKTADQQTNRELIQSKSCPTCVIKNSLSYPIKLDHVAGSKQVDGNQTVKGDDSTTIAMSEPDNSDETTTNLEDNFKVSMILDVIKNPVFHLIWYNELIFFWIFSIFCLVVVDYAIDRGLVKAEAQSLLQYWSGGEIIGRLVLTSLVDMKFVRIKTAVVAALVGLGVLLIAVTITGESFILMAFITVSVAALNSFLYILINGLLVDYLGEQHVTLGYGIASCIDGVLMSFRPSVVGYCRDYLGSYDYLMVAMAIMCLVGAALWLAESFFTPKRNASDT